MTKKRSVSKTVARGGIKLAKSVGKELLSIATLGLYKPPDRYYDHRRHKRGRYRP